MRTDSSAMSRAAVTKHMNLEHLSDAECEKILQVLQKDFELREKEKERLQWVDSCLFFFLHLLFLLVFKKFVYHYVFKKFVYIEVKNLT